MGETLNAMKISLLLIGCNYQLVFHLLQEESHTVGLYLSQYIKHYSQVLAMGRPYASRHR